MQVKQEIRMAEVKRSKAATGVARHSSKISGGGNWTVPKGKDVQGVTRHAARQVIKNYGDALGKLKKH
jgi:hypothetical protein